jgi:hypothetical protein
MKDKTILYVFNLLEYTGGFISGKELEGRVRFPTVIDTDKVV